MEEIVYDTNQLINHLKANKTEFKGLTTIFNIIEFPKALELKELDVIYPTIDDYDESLRISVALLKKGKPLPAIDLLIAAMCIRRDLTLCTLDQHFTNIKSVRSDFKLKLT
ncbi:MAG TPA: PIN domain-containing protein [Candidatus Nanoarchaeia archaeon]|nr:PIN domain-containing protein [Candidatus Nanoarchaeia archaeon]